MSVTSLETGFVAYFKIKGMLVTKTADSVTHTLRLQHLSLKLKAMYSILIRKFEALVIGQYNLFSFIF